MFRVPSAKQRTKRSSHEQATSVIPEGEASDLVPHIALDRFIQSMNGEPEEFILTHRTFMEVDVAAALGRLHIWTVAAITQPCPAI